MGEVDLINNIGKPWGRLFEEGERA